MLVEIAVGSLDAARAAVEGGADRLELNSGLASGGLTPSAGLLAEARRLPVPLVVMLRPRAGGFCYTEDEFRVLLRDLDFALAAGADAVAFGCLTAAGEVDATKTRAVVERSGGRAVFHRAFDLTPGLPEALGRLIDLGVRRVLTSGGRATALDGAEVIAALVRQAAGRIEILPGSGVTAGNAAALVALTGCDQVHASLRSCREDGTGRGTHVDFGTSVDVVDAAAVRALRASVTPQGPVTR